jgi:hypothetical protein
MRTEWELLAEKLLFDLGKAILGKSAGGMINQLYRDLGIDGTRTILKMAAEKSDPLEYAAAVIRAKKAIGARIEAISDEEFARLKEKYNAKVGRTA